MKKTQFRDLKPGQHFKLTENGPYLEKFIPWKEMTFLQNGQSTGRDLCFNAQVEGGGPTYVPDYGVVLVHNGPAWWGNQEYWSAEYQCEVCGAWNLHDLQEPVRMVRCGSCNRQMLLSLKLQVQVVGDE